MIKQMGLFKCCPSSDRRRVVSSGRRYALSHCTTCKAAYISLGVGSVSIPMPAIAFVPHPDAVATLAQFVAFCNYASRHGWKAGQDEHGNAGAIMGRLPPSDIAKLFGEFLKHGILVPF